MPPLQVNANYHNTRNYSPDNCHYVTVEDNRIHRGKVNKDIFSQAPIPYSKNNTDEHMVLSQRDIVVSANPLYAAYLQQNNVDRNNRHHTGTRSSRTPFNANGGASDAPSMGTFMDMFTNLCVCPSQDIPSSTGRTAAARRAILSIDQNELTRKIVYPVARYPARLNSPEMVQQRRRSLQKHLMFRPVIME